MQCAFIGALVVLEHMQMCEGLGIEDKSALRIGRGRLHLEIAAGTKIRVQVELLQVPQQAA